MAEELTKALERRAERGNPVGATAVLAEARLQLAADEEQRPSWRRGPAVAVATAAAVLLVVGGVLLGSRLLISESVAPAETSAPPALPAIHVEELAWSRIPSDDAIFEDARIDSVTAFDGGLIAVGENAAGAAVWTSPDGLRWTGASVEVEPDASGWRIAEVSPGGPGVVAIVEDGMVWTSPDGVSWTPSEKVFDGQHESITALAQGGPGLVAVGSGMAYTSVDGIEWTAGRCLDCSESGEFGHLADVTAGGPGLIAVGNARSWGGPAFVWTSPDGLTWSRVQLPEEVEMEGVAVGGPGFVAVGHNPRGAVVLTSPDGTSWTQVPHDEEVFGGLLMRSVVAFGDGLVALGEWDWGEGQAWTSQDGISWSRVPYDTTVFGGSSINDAVVFEDRLIAVGSTSYPGEDQDAAVWIAAEPGSFEPPTTTAPESEPRRLVTGEAVNPWRTTEITELWASEVVDVAVLPEGGFAVATRSGGGVFWSLDGVLWQDANPDGHASLPVWPDDDDLRVITALPGRLAVLDEAKSAVWLGDRVTGEWDLIELDWEDTFRSFDRMVITSSNAEILVATSYGDRDEMTGAVLAWVIDPETGRIVHSTLPAGFADVTNSDSWSRNGLEAEWFVDRWVIAAGNNTAASEDGLNWITNRDANGLATGDRFITSLTASSSGLMATSCEWAHRAWFSEDGLTWTELPAIPATHHAFAYSDVLGFVVVGERVFTSADGWSWGWTLGPQLDDNIIDLAASGDSVFILTKTHSVAATPYIMTFDQSGS